MQITTTKEKIISHIILLHLPHQMIENHSDMEIFYDNY